MTDERAFDIIYTGGYDATEKEFEEAKKIIENDLKILKILKRELKIDTYILHDCEDGNDSDYEYIHCHIKENQGGYGLVKEWLENDK